MEYIIYVLSMDGKPLMPTTRKRHIKKLLDKGLARIVSHTPFVIQLKYETDDVCQPLTLGIDPGRTNVGLCVVNVKGDVVLAAECETRNKEVPKRMEERKRHRRASRNGKRQVRRRRARKYGTTVKNGVIERRLPQCEEPIVCKDIRNKEARFCNRKRPAGWLTPTAEQLVRTHINLVRKIQKILPVTDIAVEVNRFTFMLMENPDATGLDFQNGPLKGFADVRAGVNAMQQNTCLMCGHDIEVYHHIVPRHKGGSHTLENLVGLCCKCHDRVHTDTEFAADLAKAKQGKLKKYHALSVLNQAIPYICERLVQEMGSGHVRFTSGYATAQARKELGVRKDAAHPCHDTDAYLIALAETVIDPKRPEWRTLVVKQFRRHDRARIKAVRERTYYLGKTVVAKNRRRRFEQDTPSLHEWYLEQKQKYGKAEAHRLQQGLRVVPSKTYYNDLTRVMPGARFLFRGEEYILTGQLSNGAYYRAYGHGAKNFPAKQCVIVRKNEGLVSVGYRSCGAIHLRRDSW